MKFGISISNRNPGYDDGRVFAEFSFAVRAAIREASQILFDVKVINLETGEVLVNVTPAAALNVTAIDCWWEGR